MDFPCRSVRCPWFGRWIILYLSDQTGISLSMRMLMHAVTRIKACKWRKHIMGYILQRELKTTQFICTLKLASHTVSVASHRCQKMEREGVLLMTLQSHRNGERWNRRKGIIQIFFSILTVAEPVSLVICCLIYLVHSRLYWATVTFCHVFDFQFKETFVSVFLTAGLKRMSPSTPLPCMYSNPNELLSDILI